MTFLAALTRSARRLLDVLLLALILAVLAVVVLSRVAPAVTGGETFVVAGASMEPAIPLGSAVVAVPVDPSSLATGDVVSVRVGPEQAVFTHRIARLVPRDDGLWIATKGDGNADPDPSIIPASAVIGRVELAIPFAGYAVTLLGTAQGILFVVMLAASLLAGAWLLETLEDDHRAANRRRATATFTPMAHRVSDATVGRGAKAT